MPQINAFLMKNPWVFMLILFTLFSCDLINPEDPIPSYISVEEILLDSFRNEPNSAAIFDVWVTVGGTYIGAFEIERDKSKVPLTFPVLVEGNSVEVVVNAGIYRDYIYGRHEPYNFYEEYKTFVELRKTEVTVITPRIKYRVEGTGGIEVPNLAFENFESSSFRRYISCQNCEVSMEERNPKDLNGGPEHGILAAYFEIPEGETSAIGMIQRTQMDLPVAPVEVYFEMDYNSNLNVSVSIQVNNLGLVTAIILPPTDGEYVKVYIFLTDDIALGGGQDPSVKYAMFLSSENSDGSEMKYASFDNLRIVYPD